MRSIVIALILFALFSCNSGVDNINNTMIIISDKSIIGSWQAQYIAFDSTDSNGTIKYDTMNIKSNYDIMEDSIVICQLFKNLRDSIFQTTCDLPRHGYVKSFWKLDHDSLHVYDEMNLNGAYDTIMIDTIILIPYSSNQIIFKSTNLSDTCTKQ
jgi:hypothetical protein